MVSLARESEVDRGAVTSQAPVMSILGSSPESAPESTVTEPEAVQSEPDFITESITPLTDNDAEFALVDAEEDFEMDLIERVELAKVIAFSGEYTASEIRAFMRGFLRDAEEAPDLLKADAKYDLQVERTKTGGVHVTREAMRTYSPDEARALARKIMRLANGAST